MPLESALYGRRPDQLRLFPLRNAVGNRNELFRHFEGHLQVIFAVRGHPVPEFGVQADQRVFRHVERFRDVLKLHVFAGLDGFIRPFPFPGLTEIHAVFRRVPDDVQGSQKTRHISGCFIGKLMIEIPEPVQIVQVLSGYDAEHPVLSAIVTGKNRHPVTEHGVQVFQITDGGTGRFLCVHSFIDPLRPVQAIFETRRRNELPEAQRPGFGKGGDLEAALHQRQPGEFFRKPRFLELLDDHGPVQPGPLVCGDEEIPFETLKAADLFFHIGVHRHGNFTADSDRRGLLG